MGAGVLYLRGKGSSLPSWLEQLTARLPSWLEQLTALLEYFNTLTQISHISRFNIVYSKSVPVV